MAITIECQKCGTETSVSLGVCYHCGDEIPDYLKDGGVRCLACEKYTSVAKETCQLCGERIPAYLREAKQAEIAAERKEKREAPEPPSALDVALGKDPQPASDFSPQQETEGQAVAPSGQASAVALAVPQDTLPQAPESTKMKLLLRRSQRSGMTGSVTFVLDIRVALSDDLARLVKKYRFGKEIIYQKEKVTPGGDDYSWTGIARNFAAFALNLRITINDLVKGRSIECKDIVEMRAAEDQIKEACQVLKSILESARYFDGEEVIEI